ncbi:MAG: hypothetical protein K6F30_09515 [Lachnospiraceae bacterium]|nr:hypothetical protein [Lachnospiraceae bacterium]
MDNMELMMEFFDSDELEEKYDIITKMQVQDLLNDHVIDNFAASLDVVIDDGDLDKRTDDLKNCIRTKMKYESSRFR